MTELTQSTRRDGKVATRIFYLYIIIIGGFVVANLFWSSTNPSIVPLRWATFGLGHFGFSLMIVLSITYLIDHRRDNDRTGKLLAIGLLIAMIFLQLKYYPVFFKDIEYYEQHGFYEVSGTVTDLTHYSRGFGQNVYLNGDKRKGGMAYGNFFGGGIELTDQVTLYTLPKSHFIFYYELLEAEEELGTEKIQGMGSEQTL